MCETSAVTRAAQYRQNAETLRQLATQIRFDLCRREQLLALAGAFDRLAARVEGPCLHEAAN
jgi:hypothetical protein